MSAAVFRLNTWSETLQLILIAKGRTAKEIAPAMNISTRSPNTLNARPEDREDAGQNEVLSTQS